MLVNPRVPVPTRDVFGKLGLQKGETRDVASEIDPGQLKQRATLVAYLKSQLKRKIYLIAENAKNDGRTTRPLIHNGLGMDAQWCDDFHHALRTLLTGDRSGYYQDYGTLAQLVKEKTDGSPFFVEQFLQTLHEQKLLQRDALTGQWR